MRACRTCGATLEQDQEKCRYCGQPTIRNGGYGFKRGNHGWFQCLDCGNQFLTYGSSTEAIDKHNHLLLHVLAGDQRVIQRLRM